MSKPKIKIHREPVDWIIEAAGMATVVTMISLPLVYYQALPDMIPGHFNASGEPDAYNSKMTLWLLPVTGLIIYVGMAVLNRFPHAFNYPVKITEENAPRQYKITTRMIRILNTVIAFGFCYIVYTTIQTALGNQAGLGKYFMVVFMAGVFGPIAFYLIRTIKAK